MDEIQKTKTLEEAKTHLSNVLQRILKTKARIDNNIIQLRKELVKARGDERDTKEVLLYHSLDTQRNMEQQHASPYFVRCDVLFDDEQEKRTIYFGKFPYTADSIYSWVAQASVIRFESPGRFTYETPTGEVRRGELLRKDQFMIVNGKILFMSSEASETPRELIYQEYFSQKKSEFSLREIVEQMEKAQDTIIRSHYFGSFLISGPAGSGKTTLALHRAAFLIQSPDTSSLFPTKSVVIFVHDDMTKSYFSSLLPQLGIHKVTITTFSEWAMRILGLTDYTYVFRFGKTEQEKDAYEFAKSQALHSINVKKSHGNVYKTLAECYGRFLSPEQQKLFTEQRNACLLDRFDLTILLKVMDAEKGQITETVEKFVRQFNGRYVKKKIKQEVQYSLIVVDEAENYLSQQISVMKRTIDPKTQGMIYVGDLVQRTLPFTITSWDEVQESFSNERKIFLQKVYRNTKEILEYIASVGYDVTIPDNIKRGKPVTEHHITSQAEELALVKNMVEGRTGTVIGILAKSEEYLDEFKKHLSEYTNVHVLTIYEAQGVEFDTVFLVGITKSSFATEGMTEHLRDERKRVNKDLMYVALTRAMNELHILGSAALKDVL